MAEKLTQEEILEAVAQMSVIELSELIKKFEEKFGVKAQAPVAVAAVAGAAPAGQEAAKEEEKTEFTVQLKDVGSERIKVIKAIRAITGLGLKESKALVDSVPTPVKENVPKDEAE
ncbi:MAG TPA: 50S ribosomal protein L7/L12, partial [Candidatus Atribacteria bacterium]|nr:50S ribosomal protein L7/L12 [Candidatus Atribacteria bacterium]